MLDRWSAPPDPYDAGNRPDPWASQPPRAEDAGDNPILVVDDDDSRLEMVMQILRAEGYPTAADNAKRWADEVRADGFV